VIALNMATLIDLLGNTGFGTVTFYNFAINTVM